MKHALLIGARGAGKSTLIRRVTEHLDRPVFGFETKRYPDMADADMGDPIYIHTLGQPRRYTAEDLVGWCKNRRFNTRTGAFDRYAPTLLRHVPADSILCMDELGFMETQEPSFCAAVLERLDGDIPVIAAVKDKDFSFLNTVRAHPKCRCFYVTEQTRDMLYREILEFMKEGQDT